MDPIYHVPTPKTPTKGRSLETDHDARLRIQTLYFTAGWTMDQICLTTGYSIHQVRYAVHHRLTPQKKKKCGGRPYLNTPQRKRLVEWVTTSRETRRIEWSDIPGILGWDYGEKAIRTALKQEGYSRYIARRKPPLSEQNKRDRLAWAIEHVF
jgi:transposase